MTIRYISSSKAQTSTRSPSTSRNPKQTPDPETSPRRSPRKNQKRHQRIPSQPIQLSNSNSRRPNHQPIKKAPFPVPQSSRRSKRGAPSTADQPALSTTAHPLMRGRFFVRNPGHSNQSTRRKGFSSLASRPCTHRIAGRPSPQNPQGLPWHQALTPPPPDARR